MTQTAIVLIVTGVLVILSGIVYVALRAYTLTERVEGEVLSDTVEITIQEAPRQNRLPPH